ncbi:unnamed protein product [Protopolystoma xenopodis]|uniref:Uncharacterized protein n=1 Tax=Protopolystoma xenopodis TaxID=117903 RepID=A0A448XSB8_9PLAT|nr:unnamed protein product [Protopolystoma xenopodis]
MHLPTDCPSVCVSACLPACLPAASSLLRGEPARRDGCATSDSPACRLTRPLHVAAGPHGWPHKAHTVRHACTNARKQAVRRSAGPPFGRTAGPPAHRFFCYSQTYSWLQFSRSVRRVSTTARPFARFASPHLDSTRLDSTRLDSTRLDLTRLDST